MRERPYSGYGSIIKKYRTKVGLNQTELAEQLTVTRNTVINWETERSQPDMYYIRLLCDTLTIPVNEFYNLPGKNSYTFEEDELISVFRELSPLGKKAIHNQMIALRDTEMDERESSIKDNLICFEREQSDLAAGTGIPFNDLPPKLQIMYRTPANARANTIARVSGRSMEPYYHDGDLVYIRYTDGCDIGDIVACSTADGGVIKRVNSEHKLVSLNPDYPFGEKNEDDHVRVIGKVVGIVQENDYPADEDVALYEEIYASDIRKFKEKRGIID